MTTTAMHESQDRRQFLRNLGKTLAVGLGIALVPAARAGAKAQNITRCCALSDHCATQSCPPSDARLYCQSIGCCVCESGGLDQFGCKDYSFPPC
jgi:hypothetical protein